MIYMWHVEIIKYSDDYKRRHGESGCDVYSRFFHHLENAEKYVAGEIFDMLRDQLEEIFYESGEYNHIFEPDKHAEEIMF